MPPPAYTLVWALFVFAWITNYLVRMAFAALLPHIIPELGLSYTEAGVLASAFFASYACFQFPAGMLGDRFGRRRVLLLGLVAGALASGVTGFAGSFATLLAARLATGLSQGSLFSNDRAIIAAVTPPSRIALGQAVSFSGPGFGITCGLLLGGLLGEVMPWRAVFWVFVLPPLVAAAMIRRFVPPADTPRTDVPLATRLRHVMAQPNVWLVGLAGTSVMWVQYVLATWTPLLLMESGVRDPGRAAFLASLQGLAGVVGLLAGGWVSDRAWHAGWPRKTVMAGSLLITTAAMALLAAVAPRQPSIATLTVLILVGAACAWSVWGPSFAVLGAIVGARDRGTAFGVYNTVCVLGAAVGPAVTGWTRDVTGSFTAGWYLCAAMALLGAAVVATMRAEPPAARGL